MDEVARFLRRLRLRDEAVQTSPPASPERAPGPTSPTVADKAVQTEAPATRRRGVQTAWLVCTVQTPTWPPDPDNPALGYQRRAPSPETSEDEATASDPPGRRASERSASPRGERRPAAPDQCWNCGSDTHRYSRCPEPRRRDPFCYRCGRREVTLRQCPRCRQEWLAEGPRRRRRHAHDRG